MAIQTFSHSDRTLETGDQRPDTPGYWVSKCVFWIFGAFSGASECLLLHCNASQVQTSSTLAAHSDIPGWLWLNQRRFSSCRRRHWKLSSPMVNTRQI